MKFVTTPLLENNIVSLLPLNEGFYNELFNVASDSILWEHHPIDNGYTKEGFDKFFNEAVAIGSLLILDKTENRVIGSTRIYGYNERENSVVIGHTFISLEYWGSGYNKSIKKLMLDYALTHVDKVIFYVVENNIRSRKALEKIGAVAKNNIIREYEGKEFKCLVYEIKK